VATFVYASSQGQRTHSARTKIKMKSNLINILPGISMEPNLPDSTLGLSIKEIAKRTWVPDLMQIFALGPNFMDVSAWIMKRFYFCIVVAKHDWW
jgi:hypothetical protein